MKFSDSATVPPSLRALKPLLLRRALVLLAVILVAGCGIKGPLQPPPATAVVPAAVPSAPATPVVAPPALVPAGPNAPVPAQEPPPPIAPRVAPTT